MATIGRLSCRLAHCYGKGAPLLTARLMSASASPGSTGSASTTEAAAQGAYHYESLAVSAPKPFVLLVELNRPTKANALNNTMWREVRECFQRVADDCDVRAVVLTGRGARFCAGIDLVDFASSNASFLDTGLDLTRRARNLENFIRQYQETFTVIEKCPKPVIAAIQGACVGAGVDMITACDMRYATTDAFFQVKEVDLGLAADVGTLQRLPKIVGNDSFAREAAYTARRVSASEALAVGLISRTFQDQPSLLSTAIDVAALIATKSPVAVQATKQSLVYSRDHTVAEGLDHIRLYNQFGLQTEDLMKAAQAAMKQGAETPIFSKL